MKIIRSGSNREGLMSLLKERSPSVAVIGAGPAGCSAAFALKSAGIDAFIFERGRPGKDKPCGDAFVPLAVELLSEFGIDSEGIASLGAFPFQHIDLYESSSLLWQAQSGSKNNGWVVKRALLDQKLRDMVAPYAVIYYETLVTDLKEEPDGTFRLSLRLKDGGINEFYCDAVILASGSSNLYSQRWGVDGQPKLVAAITTYAAINEPEAPIIQFKEECRPGYGWVFPLAQGQVNIGVCAMSPNNIKRLRQLASAYVAEWGVSVPAVWRGGGANYGAAGDVSGTMLPE